MKKISLLIIPILLVVGLLSGCSLKSAVKQYVEKTRIARMTTSYYQNLSKVDKKKVKFKFSQDQDETKDNYADPVYAISLKITNHSNKIVKFDKSKFVVFVSESIKFPSTKKGIVALKPGKSVSINQLIENVSEQSLVGQESYFIYLNNDNKLAKTFSVVPKPKASDKVPKNSSSDDTQQSTQTTDEDSDSNDDISQDSQSDDTDSEDSDTDGAVITNAHDAATLTAHSMGMEWDVVQAIKVNGGYKIVEPETLSGAIVHYNGDITYSNGETSSYEEIRQGTMNDPDGWSPSN